VSPQQGPRAKVDDERPDNGVDGYPCNWNRTPTHQGPGLGPRVAQLRRARGLTQDEFGARVGLSQRMVAYYESQKGNPPADLLPKFAEVLDVSIDELFGRRPRAAKTDAPRNLRLWRKLRRVETLPPKDREAVLRLIDAFFRNRDSDR